MAEHAAAFRTPDNLGDRPSRHGALLGEVLAKMAEVGATGDLACALDFMCGTCAFRKGSHPNTTAGTALIAFKCAVGIDTDRFACHHGMKDGQPQRLCAGYLAAQNAPYDLVKSETLKLHEALAGIGDDDTLRAAFDAWAHKLDPECKMDVYELARRWSLANRALLQSREATHG